MNGIYLGLSNQGNSLLDAIFYPILPCGQSPPGSAKIVDLIDISAAARLLAQLAEHAALNQVNPNGAILYARGPDGTLLAECNTGRWHRHGPCETRDVSLFIDKLNEALLETA